MIQVELTNHQKCQFIVNKFCKEPINWPQNYKIAKKLLKDNEFWVFDSLTLPYKIAGLQFFLCEDGKEVLLKEMNKKELVFPEKIKVELSETKVGADYEVFGSKTLMEFLN